MAQVTITIADPRPDSLGGGDPITLSYQLSEQEIDDLLTAKLVRHGREVDGRALTFERVAELTPAERAGYAASALRAWAERLRDSELAEIRDVRQRMAERQIAVAEPARAPVTLAVGA